MNKDREEPESQTLPSRQRNLLETTSRLIQRGLQSLDEHVASDREIANLRATKREFKGLSDNALRVVIERPRLWEYVFFFQILTGEVDRHHSVRKAVEREITTRSPEKISVIGAPNWFISRLRELLVTIGAINASLNKDLKAALGPPGQPGNAEAIARVGIKLGLLYKRLLDLSVRVVTTQHDSKLNSIFRELLKPISDATAVIESFGPSSLAKIKEAIATPSTIDALRETGLTLEIELSLTLRLTLLIKELDQILPDFPWAELQRSLEPFSRSGDGEDST